MKQDQSHRSSAIRVLIGGALAVTLGTVSSAWACTASARFDIREIPIVPPGTVDENGRPVNSSPDLTKDRDVNLVFEHSDPSEDGSIVIARGNVLTEPTEDIVTAPMAKGVTVTVIKTVPIAGVGYHYFSAWTTDSAGNMTGSSVRTRVVQVRAAQPVLVPDPVTPDKPGHLNAVNPKNPNPVVSGTKTKPVESGVTTDPIVPGVNPAVANDVNPAAGPAAGTQSIPVPGASTGPQVVSGARVTPVLPAAAMARFGQEPPRAAPAQAGARLDQSTGNPRLLAPEPSDLWSGIDPARATSLLEAPAPAGNGTGFTVGGGLLGIGTLALAGVAALAARRRLALAGPSKRS